jgi:uncharacterized protein YwqG
MACKSTRLLDTFFLAANPALARVRHLLERYARNSIRFTVAAVEDENTIPIGSSKMGGRPDLPVSQEWPWYHIATPGRSKTYLAPSDDPVIPLDGNVSLPFLGQFRMEDLAPFDVDRVLPKTGRLYFFYNDAYYNVGIDHRQETSPAIPKWYEHPGRVHVLYSASPDEMLERREYPHNIPGCAHMDFRYKPCTLTFDAEKLLPRREQGILEAADFMTGDELGLWSNLVHKLRSSDRINQLLGYPDTCSHGCGVDGTLFPESEKDCCSSVNECRLKNALDVRLILQLDSDAFDEMNLRMGRTFYIYMRNQDLLKNDFSRVWADFE